MLGVLSEGFLRARIPLVRSARKSDKVAMMFHDEEIKSSPMFNTT